MNTEITKVTGDTARGWLFFDGDCPWCAGLAARLSRLLARRGFAVAPLQTPWVRERLSLREGEPLTEMRVLTAQGRVFGGADAVVELTRQFWWARGLAWVARAPGAKNLLRSGYRWIADHRPCVEGTCHLRPARGPRRLTSLDFALAFVLPLIALAATWRAPAWVLMWSVAVGLFAGTKCLTWRAAWPEVARAGWLRSAGYWLAWPGMDAPAFFGHRVQAATPLAAEWTWAMAKTLLGVALVWGVSRVVFPVAPVAAGWVGMIGCAFCLHFGLFHLVSLCWRHAGVAAEPIMRNPLRARSVAEFWGRRWNRGFSDAARRLVTAPLARWIGHAGAVWIVFFVSGLAHELVITVPARGGYGLPTAYFLLQAAAMAVERSETGRRLGLGCGWRGWLFTVLCTAVPAYWLFSPTFVSRVFLPFLQAIGAV